MGLFAIVYGLFGAPGNKGECGKRTLVNLAAGTAPEWRLEKKPQAKISIALDDFVEHTRYGRATVAVVSTKANKDRPQLPPNARIGAFIPSGGVATGDRDLGFTPLARGRRAPDGASVDVNVCAKRPGDRGETKAGRYSGTVRVAGRSITGVEVPIEVTVKRDRRFAFIVAMFAALAGAVAAGANSRPADVSSEQVKKKPKIHDALWFMPLLIAVIAGTAAGVFIYVDDPTWGADLAGDLGKLIGASLAAATGGLTALAPVSRGARRTIANT
ncbi:hypothetical protein BH20ACT18_BH20ACT18_11100 [soil metagenome]